MVLSGAHLSFSRLSRFSRCLASRSCRAVPAVRLRMRQQRRQPFVTTTARAEEAEAEEAQADIEKWRAKLVRVDAELHKAVTTPIFNPVNGVKKFKPAFASTNLIRSVIQIVNDYRVLMSKLLKLLHHDDTNMIDGTQETFFKSLTNRFYALHRLAQDSQDSQQERPVGSVGFDQRSFTTLQRETRDWRHEVLKRTRYGRSTKSSKVKKDLPKKARLDADGRLRLKRLTEQKNEQLLAQLWRDVGKALSEYHKYHRQQKKRTTPRLFRTIAYRWETAANYSTKKRPVWHSVQILQLCDQALAIMMETAVHPIVEGRADPHSFAWRPGRGAYAASAYVAAVLERCFQKRPTIIRLDMKNGGFDDLHHENILRSYPLAAAYRPLLHDFLTAKRRGERQPSSDAGDAATTTTTSTTSSTTTTWRPRDAGVLFDSPLGKAIVNHALDGLEDVVFAETAAGDTAATNNLSDDDDDAMRVVRYGTSILLLGTANRETFERVYEKVCTFLDDRGLCPATTTRNGDNEKLPIFTFQPGCSFEYLGFKYLLLRGRGKMFGRFSRVFYTPCGRLVKPADFQVSIAPSSYKRCQETLQRLLSKQNIPVSVEVLLTRYNSKLESIAGYFLVSAAAWKQLDTLNYKMFERTRRLFRRKFQSAPKLGTFLSKFFGRSGEDSSGDLRLQSEDGHVQMSRPKDFVPNSSLRFKGSFTTIKAPTEAFLYSNFYCRGEENSDGHNSQVRYPPTPSWIDDSLRPRMRSANGHEDAGFEEGEDDDHDDSGDDEDDGEKEQSTMMGS